MVLVNHADPSRLLAAMCAEVTVAAMEVDHTLEPFDGAENQRLETMVPARRAEFLTGRCLARSLASRLGFENAALPTGHSGAPTFPEGLVGSISHAGGWVVAVVSATLRSVGVDVEPWSELSPGVARRIRAEGESDVGDPLVRFVAKEALFKAVNPLDGQWREFDDVALGLTGGSVTVDWTAQPLPAPIAGRWETADGWIAALVWVP